MKITLLTIISVAAVAAALFTLPNMEAAESKKKRTLVEVLPFEPSVEGIGFWLLDKALDEIGNETWAEIKQSVKDFLGTGNRSLQRRLGQQQSPRAVLAPR